MSTTVKDLTFTRRLYLWGATGDVFPIDQADPSESRLPTWGRVTAEGSALPVGYYRLDDRGGEFRVWSTDGDAPADREKSLLHRPQYVGEYLYATTLAEATTAKLSGDAAIAEAQRRGQSDG